MFHGYAVRSSLALAFTLFLSAAAHAQLFRAYLAPSPAGNDANPCTLPAPCRLLPAALAAVADGGEIWILDSANYNSATVGITKSVTLLAVPGVVGSVLATGGNAINIATPGVNVTLRNLVIVPLPGGGGTHGISMTNGASLTIENCLIANLPGAGVLVSSPAFVRVADTTFRGNGAGGVQASGGASVSFARTTVVGGDYGVAVYGATPATTATVEIADSTIEGTSQGVVLASVNSTASIKGSISNSRIIRSVQDGVLVESDVGAAVTVSVSNNIISNSGGRGTWAYGTGTKVWASGNTISSNGTGVNVTNGSLFESAGNNAVRNNGTDVSGTVTVPVPAMR